MSKSSAERAKEGAALIEANFGKFERMWLTTYKRDGFAMNYAQQMMTYTEAVSKLSNSTSVLKEMAMREYNRQYHTTWLEAYDSEGA